MKINETTQKKIEELLSRLSSGYQEQAIEQAIDTWNDYEIVDKQEFADETCDNYRDILKGLVGYDIKDIYDGFKKFGDECELQEIAYKIYELLTQPSTENKNHFNAIVKKALTINRHLNKLRGECLELIDDILTHADNYDYADYEFELALLEETLGALSSFDLEDSIPDKHTQNY